MPALGNSRLLLFLGILLISVLFVLTTPKTVVGQDPVCQNCGNWQSPVASPGGPYVGLTGQNIALNGWDSYSYEGWITDYYWDFGDGTWGSGPNPSHQYNADGVYTVWLTVCDDYWYCASSQSFVTVDSVNLPVRLTFDELPNNFIVADQYLNQYGVRFYSGNSFYPVHTYQNCGFCSTTSPPNFISTKPDDAGQVVVEFTQPVSNLTFYMIGLDAFFNQFATLDVYRNGALYATYPIYGNGTSTVGFTLGSLTNISKIVIRGINDAAGIGFDDFTFTVPSDIKITSGRVNGYLNGTTQNALLGADVALNASPVPTGFAGGTYAWTCTPSQLCSIVTASNSSSVTIRSTDVGTITANVSYTKNGLTASGSVTINSMLPTVTSFTAQQTSDGIRPPATCGDPFGQWWWYRPGCFPSTPGISFLSQIHVPTLLSNPAQSGVKYVQAVSTFQKRVARGLRCYTHRLDEGSIVSGWQLDSNDPYGNRNAYLPLSIINTFGNDFTFPADDSPGRALMEYNDWDFVDSLYVDDRFEMYLVYYTMDPITPALQRPLGKLAWNWGGLVVFDQVSPNSFIHNIRFTNAPPTARTGEIFQPPQQTMSSMVTMQGNVADNSDVPCPGDGALSTNRIDSSRELVKYYYLDILRRNPDASGWDYHTSNIAQCVFDSTCMITMRSQGALGFFFSPEFIQLISPEDPEMGNPPGSPNFNAAAYNPRFIYWCYRRFLDRNPDPGGFDFYMNILNTTGDYRQVVFGFIYSPEYRSRTFQ